MSNKKLENLILYICEKSEGDPGFSYEKLMWILFKSDFECYRKTGKSITGLTWIKGETCPMLKEKLKDRLSKV